jgi:hypothetical protein
MERIGELIFKPFDFFKNDLLPVWRRLNVDCLFSVSYAEC